MYRWAGSGGGLTPPFLGLVTLPKWMGGREGAAAYRYHRKPAASPEQAQLRAERVAPSLPPAIESAAPPRTRLELERVTWIISRCIRPATRSKRKPLSPEALALARPGQVLDVGANEGRFSFLAATSGRERGGHRFRSGRDGNDLARRGRAARRVAAGGRSHTSHAGHGMAQPGMRHRSWTAPAAASTW